MAQTDLINEGLLADYHDELMKTHIAGGCVFDISAYKASGTPLTPAKFANLAAALGTNGANVPVSMRKGGMSVKFIQSSDNKYVQFRYMGTATTGSPNPFLDVANWQGVDDEPTAGSENLVKSGGVYYALQGEYVVVTATANTGSVATAMVGIYDVNDVLIVEGEGEVTARILYGKTYKVKCSRVYDYLTPAEQTFTASIPSRQVTMQYTYIERDTITIDQTVSNEQSMISGDVQGDVIKAIRAASHLYLGKQTEAGNQLICQLSDTDGTKYHDGTTAAMNGSEGDQWMKLPVFWWKVTPIGTANADDTYDQYSFSFAFAGEPDPSWHKWEGDMNLLGAKKMYVTGNKGYSRSGIQGSANFTQAQGNSYAAARGTGYSCVTWEWQWIMCVLFYAWYGRMNSQAQCGSGSNINTRTLGTKDSLGMTDTTSANGNSDNTKFWGIENWWGDLTEWIGNITSQNYVVTIVDMNTKQSRTVSGWYQFGGTGGYASRFKVTDLLDFIPRAKNGTETTCYCDWVNGNTGSRVVSRSYNYASPLGGVAAVNSLLDPSYTDAGLGARLAFNGVITEAESVGDYKQA